MSFGLGCSGSSIITPDNPAGNTQSQISSLPVWVSEISESGVPLEGAGILGMYSINLNQSEMIAEMTSIRQAASPDVLEVVDIANFLNLAPCTNCVKLKSIEIDIDGNVVLTIGIKHPFEEGDPFKPITGRNRADLHIFNVEGIMLSKSATVKAFPGIGVSTSSLKLLNADGYTGYLSAALGEIFQTSASIHPYITHFDDYSQGNFNPALPTGFESVTIPHPSGNLIMPMGSEFDFKQYVLDLSDDDIEIMFAVGCTYAVSADSKQMRFTPEYRVPQHNKKGLFNKQCG